MSQSTSIVITGMGLVTSLGIEREGIFRGVSAGHSGIVPVALTDTFSILSALVPEDLFPRHPGDMAGDFSLGAAQNAWIESGLGETDFDPWQVGTLIGSSKGRLGSLFAGHGLRLDPDNFSADTIGLHVAKNMGFGGPVLNYPAACATGVLCIIRAAQALHVGELDIALAGSSEASCNPLTMAGFKNMGALSSKRTRPFDTDREGFNPGEGAAVFVLEREADARARGATVLARISGWDQRADAHHITSAETSGATVSYSIERAIDMAGWSADDVEYINAHGTGTPLNDIVEGRAISRVFTDRHQPMISSLKPNIGHLLGASSAVELGVALTCLTRGFVPPTLGLTNPDPDIPLHFVPPNGSQKTVRRFMKLSLGFGGHIGVLAVELP